MMSRRVVMLTSVHPATDVRIFHKEARSLAAHGFETWVVGPHWRHETIEGVHIRALPEWMPRAARPAQWARLWRHALDLRPAVFHLHDPELLPLGATLAAAGQRVVYDAHEFYAVEVARREWLPRGTRRLAAAGVVAAEQAAFRYAAGVVTVTPAMARWFRGRGACNVALVRNLPRLADYPVPAHNTERPPRVVYLGTLSSDRGLAVIEEAATRLAAEGIEVEVVGPIPEGARPARVGAVKWRGRVPPWEVAAALGQAAVGWVPWQPTPNNALALPTKLLEYMAAGLPVVVSDVGELGSIVRAEGCGAVVPPADVAAHMAALRELARDPQRRSALGARARQAFERGYVWEREEERFVQWYGELVEGSA